MAFRAVSDRASSWYGVYVFFCSDVDYFYFCIMVLTEVEFVL